MGDPRDPFFTQVSNPAQRPEILQTFEWQNILYMDPVRLSVSVYHEDLQDFISWFYPFTNIGNFTGNGAELTAQAKVLSPSPSRPRRSGTAGGLRSSLSEADRFPLGDRQHGAQLGAPSECRVFSVGAILYRAVGA